VQPSPPDTNLSENHGGGGGGGAGSGKKKGHPGVSVDWLLSMYCALFAMKRRAFFY